jgi:hypothetical protein
MNTSAESLDSTNKVKVLGHPSNYQLLEIYPEQQGQSISQVAN